MDIDELPLRDLSIKRIEHRDAHVARALANQERDLGWHIATLPDIIRWRLDQSDAPDNRKKINTGWCLTDTEEYVIPGDKRHEILVVHGGALFVKPDIVSQLERSSMDRGLDIDLADGYDLRVGINSKVPQFYVYSYGYFVQEDDLPSRFGIRLNQWTLRDKPNGWHSIDSFYNHPLLIARCGGIELAHAYLDALRAGGDTHFQFEHEFNHRGETPFGYIVQTLGVANISPFFGDLHAMMTPHYILAKQKQFDPEKPVSYREPPKCS